MTFRDRLRNLRAADEADGVLRVEDGLSSNHSELASNGWHVRKEKWVDWPTFQIGRLSREHAGRSRGSASRKQVAAGCRQFGVAMDRQREEVWVFLNPDEPASEAFSSAACCGDLRMV